MNDREDGRRADRGSFERGRGSGPRPGRKDAPSGRAVQRDDERPAWQTRVARNTSNREKSPLIPDEITPKDLEMGVRVQLKTLTAENADMVARHLVMAGLLINEDPQLAHKHAVAASQRAGRIAVVRETVGITAYRIADYALALRELLTHRRISGSNEHIALIVDSERGLGRPDRALEAGRGVDRSTLTAEARVNLAIAMSGARLDRDENELALLELQIPELNPAKVFAYSPDLFAAYAETLKVLGREAEAKRWDDLAIRAEQAVTGNFGPEDEVFEVLEEYQIPDPPEIFTPRKDRPEHQRRDFEPREPSRENRPQRDWSSRPQRETRDGQPEQRPERDNRPERDERPERPGWKN